MYRLIILVYNTTIPYVRTRKSKTLCALKVKPVFHIGYLVYACLNIYSLLRVKSLVLLLKEQSREEFLLKEQSHEMLLLKGQSHEMLLLKEQSHEMLLLKEQSREGVSVEGTVSRDVAVEGTVS